mgnify:CR=1 FL=1
MTKCKVKINKEIRDYTEAIFFGLSLRQFIFSVLAGGIAVGLCFLLHPYMSMETGSWICNSKKCTTGNSHRDHLV